MFCPKCGYRNDDIETVCGRCGNRFGAVALKSVYDPYSNTYRHVPVEAAAVPGKGMGIAAMITGIISVVLFWLTYLALPLAVVGAALGGMGNSKANTVGLKNGWAVAGIVCSCIALGINLTMFLMLIAEYAY